MIKEMHALVPEPLRALQPFEPDPDAIFTIEATARITSIPRHTILVYYLHQLVSPAKDPALGGFYFNAEAIRVLRRIEYLRTTCGINLTGIRMILDLTNEVETLRAEIRFRRH